jgi:hypothetical protein
MNMVPNRRIRNSIAWLTLLSAVSLLLLSAASAAEPDAHRFTYRAEAVGQRSFVTSLFDLKLKISVSEGKKTIRTVSQNHRRRQSKLISVLTAGEKGPTKIAVHYKRAEEERSEDGGEGVIVKDPTAGKVYVIEHAVGESGERNVVTDEAGQGVSREQERIVLADNHNLGRPYPLAKLLNGRTLKVGETIDLDGAKAAELFGLTERIGKFEKFTMKLTGTRQVEGIRCAVFDAKTRIGSKAIHSKVDLTGEYLIGIETCRLVSFDLSGPVKISGGMMDVTISAKGTARISVGVQYEKKKPRPNRP